MTNLEKKLTRRADAADADLRVALHHLGRAKVAAIDARDEHAEIMLYHTIDLLSRLSIQAVKTDRVVVKQAKK